MARRIVRNTDKKTNYDYPVKAALVSRNYRTEKDFSSCYSEVIKAADENQCDTVIFSMWSLHSGNKSFDKDYIFQNSQNIKRIFLETGNIEEQGNPDKMKNFKTEVWLKNKEKPEKIYQIFAKASEDEFLKKTLAETFDKRIFDGCGLMLCGESNIIKYRQSTKKPDDVYGISNILNKNNVRFIINPVHDYMIRHEMKKKRAFLSLNKRYTVSVWNLGKVSSSGKKINEAYHPWTVFYNGEDITESVEEINNFMPENDIRLGIVSFE